MPVSPEPFLDMVYDAAAMPDKPFAVTASPPSLIFIVSD
jgi:hypothetical protein